MMGGMSMNRRRLMLAIGAALFGGGWGATWTFYNPAGRIIGVAGVVSMAVGAGFFAGGWAAMHYAAQYQDVHDSTETFFLAAISMVVGAGLMGFAGAGGSHSVRPQGLATDLA